MVPKTHLYRLKHGHRTDSAIRYNQGVVDVQYLSLGVPVTIIVYFTLIYSQMYREPRV